MPSNLWNRIKRILKRVVLFFAGLLICVFLISAVYCLFFLHYSSSIPADWELSLSPLSGFDIPENCLVELVDENPYPQEEYKGYTIRRYRFEPESEDISEFFVDWFEPHSTEPLQETGAPYPLVMNGPITGGRMHLENNFSRYFADHGMAVCLVHRPKAYDDQPHKIEETGYWWRMMTWQSRLAYRWALAEQNVDSQRTATFGISNGGFRHTFFAALEPGIKAHVICLAGGDLAGILAETDIIAEQREELIAELEIEPDQFREWLQDRIELEPLDFAGHTDPHKVLMICARFDTTVPYKNGVLLWEAFGRPEFIALPAGHYTSAFAIPYIKRQALSFIQKRFESQ